MRNSLLAAQCCNKCRLVIPPHCSPKSQMVRAGYVKLTALTEHVLDDQPVYKSNSINTFHGHYGNQRNMELNTKGVVMSINCFMLMFFGINIDKNQNHTHMYAYASLYT